MTIRRKCSKTIHCDRLLERSHGNPPARGLNILTYIHMPSGKVTTRIAVHKLSAKDRGLVLNFCPWCGFDFSKRTDWPAKGTPAECKEMQP